MTPYPPGLLERFRSPQRRGRLEASTHAGHATNPLCGDELTVDLVVEDGTVRAAGFEGVGCAISLGTADILAERWAGMAASDAAGMELEDVEAEIDMQVAPGRRNCAMLAVQAVHKALQSHP